MGITDSKVYELEDKVVTLQREVKQLKEKMSKSTENVEELEKKLLKQEQLTYQLDAFAKVTSDEMFKKRPRAYNWN